MVYPPTRLNPAQAAPVSRGKDSLTGFSARQFLSNSLGVSAHAWGDSATVVPAALRNLAQETDPQIFYEDLLRWSWENRELHPEICGALLRSLATASPGMPVAVRDQAISRLELLSGRGTLGERLELASSSLISEITHPTMIAGFAAGTLASSLTRFGLLRHFRNLPAGHLLSNPNAAYLAANGGAFATEVLALHGAAHGTQFLLSGDANFHSDRLPHDLAMTAAMLGAVKIGAGLFRGIFNLGHGLHPLRGRLVSSTPWVRQSAQATGALGSTLGLYGYYRLGPNLGLAPQGLDENAAFHTLVTSLQMWGAAALTHRLLGPRFTQRLQEMETSTERLTWNWPRWHGNQGSFAHAYAGVAMGRPQGRRVSLEDLFHRPVEMSSIKDGAPDAKPSTGERPLPSRVRQVTVDRLLGDVEQAGASLGDLTPTRLKRVLDGYQKQGQLLDLLMAYEQTRSQGELPIAAARDQLRILEQDFPSWIEAKRSQSSPESMDSSLRDWAMQLAKGEQGSNGLDGFIMHMGNLGIRGFNNIFQMKREMIDFDAKVRRTPALREVYQDLYLVREFLQERLQPRYVGEDGSYISNLLLDGRGHCVSFSLLFAHFAGRLGHQVKLGLLPNHVYPIGPGGGAIETTSGFALLPQSYYLRPENFPDPKPRSMRDGVGLYFHHMGRISGSKRQLSQAFADLKVAETLLPHHPSTQFHWARYFEHQGEPTRAVEAYLRYAEASRDNPDALRKAAGRLFALMDKGHKTSEIFQASDQILQWFGQWNDPITPYFRARYLEHQGELARAVEGYFRFAETSRDNPKALRQVEDRLYSILDGGHETVAIYNATAKVMRWQGKSEQAETLEAIAEFF